MVWLRADPATLAQRVAKVAARPWLGSDPEAAIRRLDAGRHAAYDELADLVVDVDGRDPGDVAAAILAALPGE